MTSNQRQLLHLGLRLAGAAAVYQIKRAPLASRANQAIAFGLFGLCLADALDGSRGTNELLRGVLVALRQSA
jgi:hypothetical protein